MTDISLHQEFKLFFHLHENLRPMILPNGEIVISEMNASDLRNLIQRGEGTYLEFKKTIPSAEKIAREIAAFANSKGGTILVGVDDNKQISGVSAYFEEEFLLMEAAQKLCVPPIPLKIELVHSGSNDVMVVHVNEAEKKPVYIKNKKKRLVYVRFKDESILASDEQVEVLKHTYSDEGVTFEYGKNEQMLFRYLNEYGEITVSRFAQIINVTTYRASKILINLVSAGVLKIFRKYETDYFAFANVSK